jgi:hypothetical protein
MANPTLFERICNVITIWGFGASVVVSAVSQFLQSDVASRTLPSLASWHTAFSYGAFALLLLAVILWAVTYIRSRMRTSPDEEAPEIEAALNRAVKMVDLGPEILSVTTTFSQGHSIYAHGNIEHEGKITVRTTAPKNKKG